MRRRNISARCLALLGAVAAFSFMTLATRAQGRAAFPALVLKKADPAEKAEGTLGPAAKEAIEHGPLPFSDADVAAKAEANRARDEAEKKGPQRPFSPSDLAPAGAAGAVPLAPVVVGGFNIPGLTDNTRTPPDTTGVIGPTRYIQLVNSNAGIFNRTTGGLIGSGTLNQLAGVPSTVRNFDPQIIWDPATNRFYYVMDSVFSPSNNASSFGFSKTASPGNVTTDWCHYTVSTGSLFPDFPKLGDSQFFSIIGVNVFSGTSFVGSALVAISKPPAGTACPAANTFKVGTKFPLLDSTGAKVFTPVPANQIDANATGYVISRNGILPSSVEWIFNVTKDFVGNPVFGPARSVTVGTYDIPAHASQPGVTQVLDTLDARNTQAVQAIDPRLGRFAFWTQQTIKSGTVSLVRLLELDPTAAAVAVKRSLQISAANTFLFNAAISSDRRHDGAISAFGNSFGFEYNVSSKVNNINPGIVAGSSVNGGPLSFLLVKNGVGPYKDFSCKTPGSLCRWGDYSGMTPDPRPTISGSGEVWGTNQFSGVLNPPTTIASWRTEIFALKP
jgi:hypothetical protein